MSRPDPATVVARLVEAATVALPDHFGPDCCLNSTCVAIDVLREFRLTARPVSVEFVVWNPTWARLWDENGGPPADEATAQAWVAQGGWAIGVDTQGDTSGKWSGHLVAAVAGYVVDLSVGQFARPARGIDLPPAWAFQAPVGFLDGGVKRVAHATNGARAFYTARPDDRSYLAIPGFQRSPHNRAAARAVLARMERP